MVHHFDKNYNLINTHEFGNGRGATANRIFALSQGGVIIYGQGTNNNNVRGYLIGLNEEGVSSTIEIQPQGQMKVSPTISKGYFKVVFNSPHIGKMFLKVFDVTGKIVYNSMERKDRELWEKEFNLTELTTGVYFIYAQIGDYGWTQQLIKK